MLKLTLEVGDVTKANKVVRIGTTLHKFVDDNGKDVYLPCVSYHLPTTDVRLFLPQIYHQLHGGSSTIDGDNSVCVRLHGRQPNITIPIVCGGITCLVSTIRLLVRSVRLTVQLTVQSISLLCLP